MAVILGRRPGGSSGPPVVPTTLPYASGSFNTANGYLDPAYRYDFQADGDAFTGYFAANLTTVPMVAAADAQIINGAGSLLLTITDLPVSADAFDLTAQIIVSNLTGTEILRVGPVTSSIAPGNTTGSIDLSGATATPVTGTDLELDVTDGVITVSSQNGGVFAVAINLTGSWD